MSELYLPVALFSTSGFVIMAVLFAVLPRLSRRKSVELLEAQVATASGPSVDLRQQQLSASLVDRVLVPGLGRLQGTVKRLTPLDMRERVARKLVLAGSPQAWDADKVIALRLVGGTAALLLGLLFAGSIQGPMRFGVVALFAYVGFFGPDVVLSGRADRRQAAIRRALPDTIDLLTISVEAGVGFDAAMAQVVRNVPGELSKELARTLQEVQFGITRAQALRNLAERTEVEELKSFVLAVVQADVFGISVSKVLRAQAHELRTKRRQRAEELAMKLPVKILFPLVLCVLPALFVAIMGPGIIRIVNDYFTF